MPFGGNYSSFSNSSNSSSSNMNYTYEKDSKSRKYDWETIEKRTLETMFSNSNNPELSNSSFSNTKPIWNDSVRWSMSNEPCRVCSRKGSENSNSMGMCAYCDGITCVNCMRQCEFCQEVFCSFCSTLDYEISINECVLCFSCKEEGSRAKNPRERGFSIESNIYGTNIDNFESSMNFSFSTTVSTPKKSSTVSYFGNITPTSPFGLG